MAQQVPDVFQQPDLAAFERGGGAGGFSPGTVSVLLVGFGVACLAGVGVTGAFLDRFPQSALAVAVATQAAGMLGLYAFGAQQAAAVVCLMLMGRALRRCS